METKKKSQIGTQSRLSIKVSDAENQYHYTSVNLPALSCAIKGAISILAKRHKLSKQTIQLLLYIKAEGGKAKIFRSGESFGIKSTWYYYDLAENLRIRGYLSNEISRAVGRFPGYNFSLTFEGEKIISEFNVICTENMKSFLYY